MLSLSVPSNMVASYMTIVMDCLSCCKLSVEISVESMRILPSTASSMRRSVSVMVDFPAPVLPTTPILSLGSMVKLMDDRALGSPGLYWTV